MNNEKSIAEKQCIHCKRTGPMRSSKFTEVCDERGYPTGGHICIPCIVTQSRLRDEPCECYYEAMAERCPGCGTPIEFFHCNDIPNQSGGMLCPTCGDVTEYFEAEAYR